VRGLNLKKAIGTRKNRKKHDNCGFTSKAEATIWVKPKDKIYPHLSDVIRLFRVLLP
jgi:hypothetical protein